MGFLNKFWDETLAGPAPDSGLGKLQKYHSFSAVATRSPTPGVTTLDDHVPISRSITVLRNVRTHIDPSAVSIDSPPTPISPAGSSTPGSPYSPNTPGGSYRKFTRRKSTAAALHNSEAKSAADYDWIVLSALDR